MLLQILVFMFVGVVLASILAPFIINFLKTFGVIRINSRNIGGDSKAGTPIMGGLIFIIPIIIVGLIANYTIASSHSENPLSFDLFSGSIKILLMTFGIAAILGGIDDLLNIFGKERGFRDIRRILKLIKVHKSTSERIIMTILLPWTLYKNFFFILGSHPGKGVQAHEKIIVELIVGAIVSYWIYFKLGISYLWFPFLGDINIGIFMIPFIIFTIILTANAVNISDGMDGLSSGLGIIAFSGFLFASAVRFVNEPIAMICAISIGALIPYLFLNVKPARVQMGDVGSLALGTLLASVAFSINRPFLLIPFCGIFYIELISSLIQGLGRRILGRRIFLMAPLHHHFEILGYKEEYVVYLFYLVAIILFSIGIYIVI